MKSFKQRRDEILLVLKDPCYVENELMEESEIGILRKSLQCSWKQLQRKEGNKDQVQDNICEEELKEFDCILNRREREDRGCI